MHSSKRPHSACQMHVQGFLGQGSSPTATLGPRCCIRTVSEGSLLAVWNLTGFHDGFTTAQLAAQGTVVRPIVPESLLLSIAYMHCMRIA